MNYKTTERFNTKNKDECQIDFMKAKSEMSDWDWEKGGYKALYLSSIARIDKQSVIKKK